MKIKILITACMVLCTFGCAILRNDGRKTASSYQVVKLSGPMKVNGNWDKPQWKSAEAIELKYFMGETPKFQTIVQARMMYDNLVPRKDYKILEPDEIKQIEIAHILPEQIMDEITEPVTWIIEYKKPFGLLGKYAYSSKPRPGVTWRANLYKIADKTSNPHYMTWSFVNQAKPDFHLPQYFGRLLFQ